LTNKKLESIHLFYRHVELSRIKNDLEIRPDWFSYLNCFQNLITSLRTNDKHIRIQIHIIYNGNIDDLHRDPIFLLLKEIEDIDFVDTKTELVNGRNSIEAWQNTVDLIKNKKFGKNDLLYILENDYLHKLNWIDEVANIYESHIEFDYLSLYDHPDKYRAYDLKPKVYVTESHHWRSAPSTCGSFLVKPSIFVSDANLWTNRRMKDSRIFSVLRFLKQRVLITALPSLSTHCMRDHLAPTIDWEKF
jgi:hypothetical protein